MRNHLSSRLPSPAMIVAMTALFVALGGTGYAATTLVGTAKPQATAAKSKKKPASNDNSADTKLVNKLASGLSVKFANSAGSAGSAATAGHAGSADTATNATNATNAGNASNLAGAPASAYERTANLVTAVVTNNGTTATLSRGTPGATVSRVGTGDVKVTFPRDVSSCTWIATQGNPGNTFVPGLFATVRGDTNADDVQVVTYNGTGSQTDANFHLLVAC